MKEKKEIVTAYDRWLKNLVGERELFEELTEEEVYKIIFKISEISFIRNSVISDFFTFEDIANDIYKSYLIRDWEKDLSDFSDIKTEEFPFYDEKSGKYFKTWRPRTEKKGFERMKARKMPIKHFSNLIFREVNNYIAGYMRNKKFRDTVKDSLSLDIESNETEYGIAFIETVEDEKQTFKSNNIISENVLKNTIDTLDSISKESDYRIQIDRETKALSYGSLIELYQYLDSGKRVTSKEILEHIIYKGSKILSSDNKRFVEEFIANFRKYLLENKIVSVTKYINSRGKEKNSYAFE